MATPYRRTRLDKIVEEELNGKRLEIPAVLGYVKRIAERAFRHGCEQTARAFWVGTGVPEHTKKMDGSGEVLVFGEVVRPAPAKGGCACGCNDPWAHQDLVSRGNIIFPAPPPLYATPDRRTGKRRTGIDVVSDDGLFNIGRRGVASGRLIWEGMNRRRQDRRKS